MAMYLQLCLCTTYYIYIAITIYVSHVPKFPCTVLVHARGKPENVYRNSSFFSASKFAGKHQSIVALTFQE